MRLADVLAPLCVLVPSGAGTLDEVRSALLERLAASNVIVDPDRLLGRILEERGEDMVALADRAFLLHYRTDTASTLAAAMAVAGKDADFRRRLDDGTEQHASVVVMVVGPPRLAARHFQVVRAFSRLLARDEVVAAVLQAASPEAVASLSAFTEYDVPEQLLVRDLMTERPLTTTGDVPLRVAARELIRTGLGALPVVDQDNRFLGILSERELMRHLLTTEVFSDGHGVRFMPPSAHGSKTVRDAMTRQVLCVAPEQPVAEVAALMSNKDVERVPVVKEGRLVGFLTRGDIVRKLIGS